MKFYKVVILFILFSCLGFSNILAGNNLKGCRIGRDFVYTRLLGKASAYTGTPPITYYDSNGPKIPIYWGYGDNLNRGYHCGFINEYAATSYYDASIPPYGGTVNIPAENEMDDTGVQCVIAPSLGATPLQTDYIVNYSYNKPGKCGAPPTNVPLDDHLWIMLLVTGAFGAYFLVSRKIQFQ